MNCKPGDLGIVVKANHHADQVIGRIVEVIRLVPKGELLWAFWGGWQIAKGNNAWLVRCGNKLWLNSDQHLRPIRDNPGEDEMLRIVGKPSELTV